MRFVVLSLMAMLRHRVAGFNATVWGNGTAVECE